MIFGLTGFIGSGKSFVASLFKKEGFLIIDADQLAQKAINTEIIKKYILLNCGEDFYDEHTYLKKDRFAEYLFADQQRLKDYEKVIHPIIDRLFEENKKKLIQEYPDKHILYDAPLLFESKAHLKMNKIIFVRASRAIIEKRLALSRSITMEQIRLRLNRQSQFQDKAGLSDFIIDNSGSKKDTALQVQQIIDKIQSLDAV